VAFGYRPSQVTPLEEYLNPRNFTGYPTDVARALGLTVVNASCPGETTGSMINTAAPSNGCENGYRSLAPLHVDYTGSQLAFAARFLKQHQATRLVTIDIGANDLFRCQDTTRDHCTGADFGQALAHVKANLDTILATIREHYSKDLVVLTYYALNYGDAGQTEQLNAVLAVQARRYDARVASGFAAFAPAAARAGGNTCPTGLLIKLPDGSCNVHPTANGQALLAKAVEAVALRHQSLRHQYYGTSITAPSAGVLARAAALPCPAAVPCPRVPGAIGTRSARSYCAAHRRPT
jgi:lysophospholipase L1-like esterase